MTRRGSSPRVVGWYDEANFHSDSHRPRYPTGPYGTQTTGGYVLSSSTKGMMQKANSIDAVIAYHESEAAAADKAAAAKP